MVITVIIKTAHNCIALAKLRLKLNLSNKLRCVLGEYSTLNIITNDSGVAFGLARASSRSVHRTRISRANIVVSVFSAF